MSENFSDGAKAVLENAASTMNFYLSEIPRLSTRNPMKAENCKKADDLRDGIAEIKAALDKLEALKDNPGELAQCRRCGSLIDIAWDAHIRERE